MSDKTFLQRLKEKEVQKKKDKRLFAGGLTGVAAALFLWQSAGQEPGTQLTNAPYEISQGYSSEESTTAVISAEWQTIIDGISPYEFDPSAIPEGLLENRDFIITAVSKNIEILKYIPVELTGDRDIIMAAANKSPLGLAYATAELKSDKDMVLYAVSKYAAAIHFVDEKFYGDKDVMRIIAENAGTFFGLASEEIRADRELAKAAVRNDVNAYYYIADELKSDLIFAKEAVRGSGFVLLMLDHELGVNPEIYNLTDDKLYLSRFVNSLAPEDVSKNPELLAYINYLDVLDAREGGFDSDTAISLKYESSLYHARAVLEEYKAKNPDWFEKAKAANNQALEAYNAVTESQNAQAEEGYWTWQPFKGFYPKHWDTQPKP